MEGGAYIIWWGVTFGIGSWASDGLWSGLVLYCIIGMLL